MKITKVVKTAVKWGPIILPVVMKFVNDKKQSDKIPNRKR